MERRVHTSNPTIGSSNFEEWPRLQLGTWILLNAVSVSLCFPVWEIKTTFRNHLLVHFFGAKFIYIPNGQMEITFTHQHISAVRNPLPLSFSYVYFFCVHSGSTSGASKGQANKTVFRRECQHFLLQRSEGNLILAGSYCVHRTILSSAKAFLRECIQRSFARAQNTALKQALIKRHLSL